MTTLIIGNSRTAEMVGDLTTLSPAEREIAGYSAQRVLWSARDGDIVVLPRRPANRYLAYLTTLTRTDPESLTLVVPPPGRLGADLLTPDRLAHPAFRDELRAALRGRQVDRVLAVYKDPPVAALARAVGLASALPGHAFSAQGGDALVNSKAAFRAIAAGAGVATAEGTVASSLPHAREAIIRLLAGGHPVMVKKEFNGGGLGNEILSSTEGVSAAGAPRVTVLPDQPAVTRYLAQKWDWLTDDRAHRLVVERYFPGCRTIYAEFLISDDDIGLLGVGEILMDPVAVGEIVPPQELDPDVQTELITSGRWLCESFHALGYRGNLSADAILTPDGDVIFTEANGRLTGSTHLHTVIGGQLVGPEHRADRVIVERSGWAVPSFSAAVDRLAAAGLSYDPNQRSGVLLTSDRLPGHGTVTYCVVAQDLATARDQQRRISKLFPVGGP